MKPNHLIENGYVWLDDRARESVRLMARLISRRSFLTRTATVDQFDLKSAQLQLQRTTDADDPGAKHGNGLSHLIRA